MENKKVKTSTSSTTKKASAKKEVKETKTKKEVKETKTAKTVDSKDEKKARTSTETKNDKMNDVISNNKDKAETKGFVTARFNRGFPNKFGKRKKFCKLCAKGINHVDYKNVELLYKHLTSNLKIASAKITFTCRKHQTMVSSAIKRARLVALIPYIKD